MSVSNSRKSNENILAQLNRQQHDGSLLNIPQIVLCPNTASDINIYNNSFIVNTNQGGGKKQSQSQNNSRSNSLKRSNSNGKVN
jgi:hypothetical protein